jgi:hypothetical protein
MRTTMLAVLATVLAVPLTGIGPAQAQNYPWCGQRGDGSRSCAYVSYEQCMAETKSRACERNFQYQPPAGTSQSRRTPRPN